MKTPGHTKIRSARSTHHTSTSVKVYLSLTDQSRFSRVALGDQVVVVLDVLRATSSIITGLFYGAKCFIPARTVAEAHRLKLDYPSAMLAGERRGKRISGFDLGNSPLEFVGQRDNKIILTTTNGTKAIRAVEKCPVVLIAALLNLDAVARYLNKLSPPSVLIVCAGSGPHAAFEDVLVAGLLVNRLSMPTCCDDGARIAALIAKTSDDSTSLMKMSKNARFLQRIGIPQDVTFCTQDSVFPINCLVNGREIIRVDGDLPPSQRRRSQPRVR